ncbi:PREDICTED: cadherin-13-like, partial [Mesitornis unicolor]|uniref:cadherin-13-like n=1 Tax=Mesitornis unicolor TaxID=54374 RepID=UPI0005286E28
MPLCCTGPRALGLQGPVKERLPPAGQSQFLEFDDCKGNNKLNFEVSNPDFKVERDGSLVALKNVSEAGRALFVHARTEHAEDLAEILIVGANEKHGALK